MINEIAKQMVSSEYIIVIVMPKSHFASQGNPRKLEEHSEP